MAVRKKRQLVLMCLNMRQYSFKLQITQLKIKRIKVTDKIYSKSYKQQQKKKIEQYKVEIKNMCTIKVGVSSQAWCR